MILTLKPEYVGDILEIIRYEKQNVKFDTNVISSEEYQYYYDIGFDWAFDVQ
jgi:hypothetical protein